MELALAIRHGITVQSLKSEFHPYLTLSEGIKLAAIDFDKDVMKLILLCSRFFLPGLLCLRSDITNIRKKETHGVGDPDCEC